MHQRVGLVRRHHCRIVRNEIRIEPVADPQVGGNPGKHREQEPLKNIEAGIERRRRQHQPLQRPHAERHQPPRHQPAHAVPEHDQRCARTHPEARFVDHFGQVRQQAIGTGQRTALAHRFAVAVLVVGPHGEAPLVQAFGQQVVAPGMFAQTVHDQHHAAYRAFAQGPVHHHQVGAVPGGQGAEVGAAHGTPAITLATAAVSFLANGTCRNSLGPWALLFGPSTPHTIICALGKPRSSMFIRGIVPPCPM